MLAGFSVLLLLLILSTSCIVLFNFNQKVSFVRSVGHVLLGIWALTRLEHKLLVSFYTTFEHFALHLALGLLCVDTLLRYYRSWRKHKRDLAQENSQGEASWLQL